MIYSNHFLTASSCGKPQIAGHRVIGGINAVRGSWPWQILLLYNSRPICGGTLVTPSIVVTAAHCISSRAGSHMYKVRYKTDTLLHVAYALQPILRNSVQFVMSIIFSYTSLSFWLK